MSQVENLLNSVSEEDVNTYSTDTETEPHIVINSDRTITVPNSLKKIAVQYDHNVETITFDCPRYWDGLDMSEMHICINFMRPDGKIGSYLINKVTIDETDDTIMHFDWTILSFVTQVKGSISFLVCCKKTESNEDGSSKLVNHWNTELNRDLYVSEGLEVDTTIISYYPAIVEQILTEIEIKTDEQLANAIDAYIEAHPVVSGQKGEDGADGIDGKSAYTYAQEGGYDGSESEFIIDLAHVSDIDNLVATSVENEKGNMINTIITELQGLPVFGVVDENNTITVTSQLSDGVYTLKYENTDGTYSDIGTITVGDGEKPEPIINWIPISTETTEEGSAIYNSVGYKTDTRLSTSTGEEKTQSGFETTGFIPVKMGDVLYFKNIVITDESYNAKVFYDEDGNFIKGTYSYTEPGVTDGTTVVSYTIPESHIDGTSYENVAYIRISASEITADSIITVNQPIE